MLFLFQHKEQVLGKLRWLRAIASISALALFIFYYGFPHSTEESYQLIAYTKGIFGFFIASYLIRVGFSLHSWTYIKSTLFEALLILLLLADILSAFLLGFNAVENVFIRLNIENFTPLYILFIQAYLLLLVGLEIVKMSVGITNVKLKPATTFIFSFVLLIFAGAGLLMLPEMTTRVLSVYFSLFQSSLRSLGTDHGHGTPLGSCLNLRQMIPKDRMPLLFTMSFLSYYKVCERHTHLEVSSQMCWDLMAFNEP